MQGRSLDGGQQSVFLDEVQDDEIDPNATGFITSTNIAYSVHP